MASMALREAGRRALSAGIRARVPFRQGNVSGRSFTRWGLVPQGQRVGIPGDTPPPTAVEVYVIFSYKTPVAWGWWCDTRNGMRWSITTQRYSVTTSGHVSAVGGILASLGWLTPHPHP